MSNSINLALVGASGVVGSKIISIFEKKNIAINNFYPLGSSSVGNHVIFNDHKYQIEELATFDSSLDDIAIFFPSNSSISSSLEIVSPAAPKDSAHFVKSGLVSFVEFIKARFG